MNSEDRVSAVKGIGAKTESHLGPHRIYTVGDFIEHYPREYHTYDVPISIDNTEFDKLQAIWLQCCVVRNTEAFKTRQNSDCIRNAS